MGNSSFFILMKDKVYFILWKRVLDASSEQDVYAMLATYSNGNHLTSKFLKANFNVKEDASIPIIEKLKLIAKLEAFYELFFTNIK